MMTLDLRKFIGFNIEKIIQVLAYIQRNLKEANCPDVTNKLKLVKLLFFADRLNLRGGFGFISLDTYYAFKNGPAASQTLDVINKYEDKLNMTEETIANLEKVHILNKMNREFNESNTNYISEIEVEMLDKSCSLFGKFTSDQLIEITHDYPEWKRYANMFNANLTNRELIKTDDFFTNPNIEDSPALKKYFQGKDPLYVEPDYLNDVKEIYSEMRMIKDAYK